MHTQKGFSLIEGLLIVLVISVIGFGGYYVWSQQDDKETNTTETVQEVPMNSEAVGQSGDETANLSSNSLSGNEFLELEEPAVIVNEKDVDSLPAETPGSFVEYLREVVRENTPDELSGCVAEYTISIISNVNVAGGISSIDEETLSSSGSCGAGAKKVWVYDGNSWDDSASGQDAPVCSNLNEPVIYSEFVEKCYEDSEGTKLIDNPNGSITNSVN